MAKSKDNEGGGPTVAGSVIIGLISALVGAFLAAANLAFLPVSAVKELPEGEDLDPKAVYFIQGEERGGTQWSAKRDFLTTGRSGAIVVTEGELNRWARSKFRANPKGKGDGGVFDMVKFHAASPNFRIAEGLLQISAQMNIPLLKGGKIFVYQTQGSFDNDSGVYEFKAESGYLGRCPIPSVVNLPAIVFNMLSGQFADADEFAALEPQWASLTEIRLEGRQLVLVRP